MEPRKFLEVVLDKCPAYSVPLPDCALCNLRSGSDTELRNQQLAAMSEEEVDETIRKHFLCVCRKNGCGT